MPTERLHGPMSRRRPAGRWLHFGGFPLGLVLLLATGCSPQRTVEQEIIAVIREMEARIEAVERRPFMSHVAADFTAQGGQMNRDQFNALVLSYLHRYKRVNVRFLPIRVTAGEAGQAAANFRVVLTGGEGLLPEAGQLYEVATHWQRVRGDWLLHAADWKRVELEQVLDR